MDSERSKAIVRLLHSATNNTQHYYGNDVKTAAQLLNHVLQYESQQAGFDLTAMKDAEFNEVEKETNFYKMFQGINKVLWIDFNWTIQSVQFHFLYHHIGPKNIQSSRISHAGVIGNS